MGVHPTLMSEYHMCTWCLRKTEVGTGSPGTGLPDGCDPLCGCLELNLDSLEEQLMLLTAEPIYKLKINYKVSSLITLMLYVAI